MNDEKVLKYIATIFFTLLILIGLFFLKPFYIVDPGYTALHLRLGKIIADRSESGWYYKVPFFDSIVYISNRISKSVIATSAFSKDLQTVEIEVAINYKIEDPLKLYQSVGTDFENVIVNPFTQESVKAVVAKFTAEDLIQHRHTAKDMVGTELRERLKPLFISLVDFNIIHSDFHTDFIKAVEEKQIADQVAKKAKYATERVKEEVLQTKARAEADAYILSVQRDIVTDKMIEMKKIEALVKAIEKWNGQLPSTVTGGNPFLLLDQGRPAQSNVGTPSFK